MLLLQLLNIDDDQAPTSGASGGARLQSLQLWRMLADISMQRDSESISVCESWPDS